MKKAYTVIDMATYSRLQHFNYFNQMGYPYVGVTSEVDITDFLLEIKAKKYPFFLSVLWCVAQDDGTYCYCTLDPSLPFERFIKEATLRQEQAKTHGDIDESEEDVRSLLFISTLPWLSYTSLVQPVPIPADSNPRITWGKYTVREGRTILPVSVLCHHGLVDGKHLGDFFARLDERLEKVG